MMNKLKGLISTVMLTSSSTFAQSVQLNEFIHLILNYHKPLSDARRLAARQKTQHNIAVVVVDPGGNTLMANRHENVGPHKLGAAKRKPIPPYIDQNGDYAVKSKCQMKNRDAKNLTTLSKWLLLGGGLPVKLRKSGGRCHWRCRCRRRKK